MLGRVFKGETDLKRDLPVIHFARINATPGLHDLKPRQVLKGLVRPLESFGDGVLHRYFRCACEFNNFVNGVFHKLGSGEIR